jgi:hypothetical protein
MANERYEDDRNRFSRYGRDEDDRDEAWRAGRERTTGGRYRREAEPRSFSRGAGHVEEYAQGYEGSNIDEDYARNSGYGARYGEGGGYDRGRWGYGYGGYKSDTDFASAYGGQQGRGAYGQYGQGRPGQTGLGPRNPTLEHQAEGDFDNGPHRGKGPKNYTRSDDRIREDVSDRLSDDPYLDASEIVVDVKTGEVTLSGHVESRQAKRRSEDCAEAVSGVKHVQNNLRVGGGAFSNTDPEAVARASMADTR